MKLIDILVDAGDAIPLFGVHTKYLAMDPDGRVHGYCEVPSPTALGWVIPDALYSTDGRGCLIQIDRDDVDGQWQSAIITREQYEAALAAKNDGWIEWGGGECPVEEGELVDVKYRDGAIKKGLRALIPNSGRSASRLFWVKDNLPTDIIAYCLHQPNKAGLVRAAAWNAYAGITESDAESDLNDCISQDSAPVWGGEGQIPPVGCVCERSWAGDEWQPCKILFASNQLVVVKLKESGMEDAYNIGDVTFRPIRSVADKKRDEAVKTIMLTGWCQTAAEEIYDLVAAGKVPGMKLED